MDVDGYEVEPLTPDRFDDFAAVLGRSGVGGCWCMYWIAPTSAAWGEGAKGGSTARNRVAFEGIVTEGPPPGLLAYDGGDPVGWCRVTPRSALPGLANSRHFKTDLDTDGVWSLSCFVIKRSHRSRGLTEVLTKAAIEFTRSRDGAFLEVYPWDTDEKKSESVIYTGVASTFRRLGFEAVQARVEHRPMMRIALGADSD